MNYRLVTSLIAILYFLTQFASGCKPRQTFTGSQSRMPNQSSWPGSIDQPWQGISQSQPGALPPGQQPGVIHPDLIPSKLPQPSATPLSPPISNGGDYNCRANLTLRSLSKTPFNGNNYGSRVYQEVMEYAYNSPLFRHFAPFNPREPETDVHETMHGYGSYGRGYFRPYDADAFHFLYLENGRGVDLARSKTRKQDVIRYIPRKIQQLYSVRDSSNSPENFADTYFQTYFTQQMNDGQPHHSQAGHLFEEWNCYIQDQKTAIELSRSGRNTGTGHNFVSTYFAIAAAYATSQVDPNYFRRNDPRNKFQLKAAFACLAEQAMANYHQSPFKSNFSWRPNSYLYNHLRTSSESKHLRDFLYQWYGATWVSRVFQF